MDLYKSITCFALGLCLLCFNAIAQDSEQDDEESSALQVETEIEATRIQTKPGETEYTEETINKATTGEGTLADLLKLNPSVDFSRNSDTSAGTATLRPDEISIHGQTFYQNLFLIDGSDTTNDLNPADSSDLFATPSLVAPHGGSSPQGYYLDVDLLDVVQVYDSNIPVEYGGFTGGVVASELKSYKGDNNFSFTYGLQRDEWEEFHVSEDDISTADRYRAVYTPDYEKSNYKLSAQYGITDNIGLTIGITNRVSTFAQQFEDDTDTINMIDYDDSIQNIVGKINSRFGSSDLSLSFRSTTRTHDGLTSTNYTGRFEKEHSGIGGTIKYSQPTGWGSLDLTFSLDELSDTLDSEQSMFTYHEYLENSGMSRYEGAFGDSEQQQTRWSFKPQFSLDTLNTMGFIQNHSITFGGEIRNTSSFYKRPEDVVFEQYFCIRDNGREGCRDQDGDGRSSAGDEFLQARSFWFAGEVDVSYEEASMYVEDKMKLGKTVFTQTTTLTVGLRGDWESYLENFNISPRISVDFNLLEGTFTAGLSRYYGRSFFRYELNDAIYGWREIYTNLTRPRGRPGEEVPCSVADFVNCTHRTFENRSGASNLDTPYSDEIMIGWYTTSTVVDLSFQIVNRESKDGVARQRDENRKYFYTNDGRSSTQSASVTFTTSRPYEFGSTETTANLSLGYRNTKSNRQDDDGYDDQLEMDLVYYDNKLVKPEDLPAWDYNIPFSIGFFTVTKFPQWNLNMTNFFSHRRGGTIARDTGRNWPHPETGNLYDIYADFDFDSLFTVNSKLDWQGRLTDNFTAFATLEIHNLFDQVIDRSLFETRRRFSQGRRFWIEMGVRFK